MGSHASANRRDLKYGIVRLPEVEREPGDTDHEAVKDSADAFVTREPKGLVIEVPHAGVLRAGKVWIRGGSVLCFFTILMTFLAVKKVKTDNPLLLGLMLGVAWAIVLFHFAYAIHVGHMQARLTVFGNRLTIVVTGLFRSSEWHCLCSEIAVIQCGQCGKEHKGEFIMELQIILSDGKVKRLLCGRDYLELKSIERELRQALDSPGGRSRFIRPH